MIVLKVGSRGERVKQLQEKLNLNADGIFGKNTEVAVRKFQSENGLVVDGLVGPSTWDRIMNSGKKEVLEIGPVILRVGSRGEDVVKLQKSLNLNSDGIFGKGTEAAVIDFQSKNGLKADGVVGPLTLQRLGFTIIKEPIKDIVKNEQVSTNGLKINVHYLPKGEYFMGSVPKYVFLHHTAGWYNPYKTIDAWASDNRGQVATEFVLGGQSIRADEFKFDGELVQCLPRGGWGWHLGTGKNHVHKNSVGIEVNNFGYVTEGGYHGTVNGKRAWIKKESGKFYTYSGAEIHPTQMVELDKPFRGHKFWHRYSATQISVLKDWLYFISERDGIDITKGLPELIKQRGVDAFEYNDDVTTGKIKGGVWTHTNVRKDKVDMFPQPELLAMLESL